MCYRYTNPAMSPGTVSNCLRSGLRPDALPIELPRVVYCAPMNSLLPMLTYSLWWQFVAYSWLRPNILITSVWNIKPIAAFASFTGQQVFSSYRFTNFSHVLTDGAVTAKSWPASFNIFSLQPVLLIMSSAASIVSNTNCIGITQLLHVLSVKIAMAISLLLIFISMLIIRPWRNRTFNS